MPETAWQIEPELEQPLPRGVTLRRRALFEAIVLSLGLLVLGGFSIGMLAWEAWLTHCGRVAEQKGSDVYVEVISKRKLTGRYGGTTGYQVAYRFRGAVDQTHEASRKISRRDFERIKVGDSLPARAVPGRFEFHTLTGLPRAGLTHWQMGAMAAFLVAAPFLVSMFLGQKRREKDLIRFGLAVPGIVGRKSQFRRGRSRYEATFTAAGTEHKIVGIVDSEAAWTGGSLTVLHDPLDPERAAIYAACQYRARRFN